MSFASYSDIQLANMEAMVSSSIEKFRVQSASTKEPNLLYKLMVSKVIAKLKAVLFDPAFAGHHDQQKENCQERRRRRPLNQQTESSDDPVVTVAEPVVKDRSPVQTQLQTLLRKRIAAKLGRAAGSGESRAKVRRLSSKDELVRPPPRDTPDLTRRVTGAGGGGAGGGGCLTLLIPFQCLSQTG